MAAFGGAGLAKGLTILCLSTAGAGALALSSGVVAVDDLKRWRAEAGSIIAGVSREIAGQRTTVVAAPTEQASTEERTGGAIAGTQAVQDIAALAADAGDAQPGEPARTAAVAVSAVPTKPTFDIVRVERDGSMLVAGKATARAEVELVTPSGNVLARGKAGDSGDFVLLPTRPLLPGDHSINLRATSGTEVPTLSDQAGIVHVPAPERKDDEVLVVVAEVGKASRIIDAPGPDIALAAPADTQTPSQAETLVSPVAPDVPSSATADGTQRETVLAALPARRKAVASISAKDTPDAPERPVPAPDEPERVVAEPPATPQVQARARPSSPAAAPHQSPEVPETAPEPAAAVEPAAPELPVAKPDPTGQVAVEAVEVEGDRLFVAGAVTPRKPVRVYVDNKPVGEAVGSSDGRFLVSELFDLKPGEHHVRADVIDRRDGSVVARAEVPLLHEPFDERPVGDPVPEPARADARDNEAPREAPAREAAAVAATFDAAKRETDGPQSRAVSTLAPEAPTALESEPGVATNPTVEKRTGRAAAAVEGASSQAAPVVAEGQPAATTALVAARTKRRARGRAGFLRTGTALIIKPGDNLWQISRRTYGRGVRYTTIYNANRDQIRDPNRIYIGQIFRIPGTDG